MMLDISALGIIQLSKFVCVHPCLMRINNHDVSMLKTRRFIREGPEAKQNFMGSSLCIHSCSIGCPPYEILIINAHTVFPEFIAVFSMQNVQTPNF